jgi:hypothetical protein
MRLLLTIATLLIASTASAQDDVGAIVISSEFSCHIGTDDPGTDPTAVVAKSVQLYRADEVGFTPECMDMGDGVFDVRVGFTLPFVAGVTPMMRAYAYSALSCSGLKSIQSPNACTVTHILKPPTVIP